MGERAGYRVAATQNGKRIESWIARRQWYLGGSKTQLESWVQSVAAILMDTQCQGHGTEIDDGCVALRNDLDIGRLSAAVIRATFNEGFNSLEPAVNCDIDDHGLFELELVKWNRWNINHYATYRKKTSAEFRVAKKIVKKGEYVSEYVWGELQPRCWLGTVEFTAGKTLKDGIKFSWNKNFKEF